MLAALARLDSALRRFVLGRAVDVTHADLKEPALVHAFFNLVGDGLAPERGLFEGRG